jgi:molybdopterin converting factor small subunit
MMIVKVILKGPLLKYGDGVSEITIESDHLHKTGDLIEHLGIPPDSYSFMSVRGMKVGDNQQLEENDVVTVFPPVSGG